MAAISEMTSGGAPAEDAGEPESAGFGSDFTMTPVELRAIVQSDWGRERMGSVWNLGYLLR